MSGFEMLVRGVVFVVITGGFLALIYVTFLQGDD